MSDSYKKTIFKSISWRVIGTLITGASVYIASGSVTASVFISSADAVIKTIAYFVHERFWTKIM